VTSNNKDRICRLLKGIETGDPSSVSVVNEKKYIQHNPQTREGSEGLADLFKRLSKTLPRVNIVRVFEDGDFIFAHTEYDFETRNIGFEIFRFEGDQAIEHWDNIQQRKGPNLSNHSMVDGEIDANEHEKTDNNRILIQLFIKEVLIEGHLSNLDGFINQAYYTEHSPLSSDDLGDLRSILTRSKTENATFIEYMKCHRILAEGNFVLSVCEGYLNQKHTSFFDLYRIKHGKVVEHWGTTEKIPDRSEWKNDNGKF